MSIERPVGFTYAVLVEHPEDQRGEFRRIALRKELLVDLYEALKSRNRHSYLRAASFLAVSIDFRLINVPAETRSYLFRQQAVRAVFQESFVPKQTVVVKSYRVSSYSSRAQLVPPLPPFPITIFFYSTNGWTSR